MQGGEMVSTTRTIRQYCSVCKATLDMGVVDTVQDHEVTWLKCPRCNGILPHMLSSEDEAPKQSEPEVVEAPATGFDESERQAALDYDASGTYEVGQVVYHRSINKFGRVAEKTMLPGGRAAIRLVFEDGDEMTLREQA